MQPTFTPRIKSRPIYISVDIDNAVKNHFFIAEEGADTMLRALFQYCRSDQKTFIVIGRNQLNPTSKIISIEQQNTLSDQLSKFPISTNIYISGMTEAFLWDVHNLAIEAGMTDEQVKKLAPLSSKRRLFCTHCYAISDDVSTTPFKCPSCHRSLLVRDHFSRNHSAYVGVMINAEDPSETPEQEAVT